MANGAASDGPSGADRGRTEYRRGTDEDMRCPKCGDEVEGGYGLAGGEIGPYVFCLNDDCDYFVKQAEAQDDLR